MHSIILLHGALGHTHLFDPYEEWLQARFNVHKVLLEGHGNNPLRDHPVSIESYTEQLDTYLKEHQIEQADVFGYSMGGYIALWHSLQHPGIISSIATLATKLHWTEEGAAKESQLLIPENMKNKVPQYAQHLAEIHGDPHWEKLVEAMATLMLQLGKKPLLTEEQLRHITIPVQLMTGDKDKMTTVAETCRAASVIPNARLAILPDTRHPLDQVRPQLLKVILEDFWDSLSCRK